MTFLSCCSLLFLLLFIESVCSISNTFQQSSSPPMCSYPYSCILTSECAERHAGRALDEVLFRCEGKETVCCPPLNPVPSVQGTSNGYTTTERNIYNEPKRPENIMVTETPVRKEISPQAPQEISQNPGAMHHHNHGGSVDHNSQSSNPRPGQFRPSESKRPPVGQPTNGNLEGRRPAQPQPSGTSAQASRPQNPQSQPSVPQSQHLRPQNPQPQPSVTPTQASRPQNPQPQPSLPQTQHQRPQNPQPVPLSLTTHRNFRLLPTESECGVNSFANRITEGEEVSLGEYPWMVLTGLKDKYGNYRWNCGGTLINKWYVLTAAHCVMIDNRTIEYVRLGEHSLTNDTDCYQEVCLEPPEDIAIAEVIPHERWNTTTIKNDIALLRLSRNPLKLGKSNIYPICLPLDPQKLNLTSSTKYEVAGWGKTDWNADEGSDVLRKASISGVNREECNICKDKKKQQYCPITDTQLCVQGWKSVDVCKGDSGGPLMVTRLNIYQIGITSFKGSEYCGAENIPSIFTKVESYLPWILDNIRE